MKLSKLLVLGACSLMMATSCGTEEPAAPYVPPIDPPETDPVEWEFEEDGDYYAALIKEIKATQPFELVIPSEHEGRVVNQVGLASRIFITWHPNNEYVTSVYFPDSITRIPYTHGEGLLDSLPNLESVRLSPNCKAVPQSMFDSCPKLKEVTVPEGVTSINRYAFVRCGIETIHLPTTLDTIGEGCFYLSNIKNIDWAEDANNSLCIETKAFECCYELEEFVMPDYVYTYAQDGTYTNSCWLKDCENIKKIRMSGKVGIFRENMLGQMSRTCALEELIIPASVIKIEKRCLYFSPSYFNNIDTVKFEGTKAQWLAIEKDEGYLDYVIGDYKNNSAIDKVYCMGDGETVTLSHVN